MNKLFLIVAWVSILCAIGGFLLFIFWSVYPYKTVVFLDTVFPVQNKTVTAGTDVLYTSRYCKYMNLPALVTRTFKDELVFVTPSTVTNRPMGCNSITVIVTVPKELPAGKYVMQQVYQIQVNPVRTITITKDTESFTVVAP